MNDFIDLLISETQRRLGDRYALEAVVSIKNNNQMYQGIQVRKDGSSVCPVYYVTGIYEDYRKGYLCLIECAELLIRQILNPDNFTIEPGYFNHYENIKDQIHIMLVNYDANKEQLKEKPYFGMLDLAATFYVDIPIDANTSGVLHISNDLIKLWGFDAETFINIHLKEVLNRDYAIISDIEDTLSMLAEKLGRELPEELTQHSNALKGHMYVLTNTAQRYGASMLLNTAVLHQFATLHDDDLIIYPSSVHEVMITFKKDKYRRCFTVRDIAEINVMNIRPEERLSNNMYLYDRDTKKLSILAEGFSLAELDATKELMQ